MKIGKDYETEDRQTQFLGRDNAENDLPTQPSYRFGLRWSHVLRIDRDASRECITRASRTGSPGRVKSWGFTTRKLDIPVGS